MQQTQCATCGREWPNQGGGALQGGCPYCLLAFALGNDDEPNAAAAADGDMRRLGPYTILETLGQGGMGIVYKARHESLGRIVALKVLNPTFADRSEFPLRFQREGQVLACLAHPHIVAIHDLGCDAGQFYLAMEYVAGQTLRQSLTSGPLPWQRAVAIVRQLAAALEHAHGHGIVHRDIKPENILIDPAGAVHLGDFGIAKLMSDDAPSDSRLTQTQVILGSRSYMAPEQVMPGRAIDQRADIYALGVVLYEMLTGELPLGVFPPPSLTTGVDARLDPIVRKCLEKNPEQRFPNAAALDAALQKLTGTARRYPLRRALLKSGALMVLATGLLLVVWSRTAEQPGTPVEPPTTAAPRTIPDKRLLTGHGGRLWCVAFPQRGDWLASASEDRTLRLWDGRDGKVLASLPAFPRGEIGPVAVAIAADANTLATAGGEGVIRLWDVPQRRELLSWQAHGREITALRFAPTGSTLASASHDRSVKLWDAPTKKLLHTLSGHTDPVLCLAFSADGQRVAAGAMNGGVRVWDAASGTEVATCGHARRVWAVAFAPDTGVLATGSHEGLVKIWDLSRPAQQRMRGTLDAGSEVWSLAYSPDGRVLAVGCQDGMIRLWDARTQQPLGERRGHGGAVVSLSFSADGKQLASASWDQTARVWDAPPDKP